MPIGGNASSSVLGVSIPYRPWFYVHVGLLHGQLGLRVAGDLWLMESLRWWGSWGNVAAILLFLVGRHSGRSRETTTPKRGFLPVGI